MRVFGASNGRSAKSDAEPGLSGFSLADAAGPVAATGEELPG
jgi:hypothetical protein